jgi:serine/threonine protein kinase
LTHASRRSDYIVEQALGGGGMGTVYFAQHTMLDKQVDKKYSIRKLRVNPASQSAFIQEADIQAKLKH